MTNVMEAVAMHGNDHAGVSQRTCRRHAKEGGWPIADPGKQRTQLRLPGRRGLIDIVMQDGGNAGRIRTSHGVILKAQDELWRP
jgi:hypothetical protein